MRWKALLISTVAATLAAAPTAAGSLRLDLRQLRTCPERAAGCIELPAPLQPEKPVRLKSVPLQVTDARGRVFWHYGRWMME